MKAGNARTYTFDRRECFGVLCEQQIEAAKLDAAIAVNLKELGYGG